MPHPKNQHWLPQFYLRKFAVPGFRDKKNAKIWVMDIEDGNPQPDKVNEVACSDFLYSHLNSDGSRCFRVEKKLAKLETQISQLYPRMAEGYPDLHESLGIKKFFALFITTLMLRHPDYELTTKNLHGKMVDLCEQQPKDEKGHPILSFITEKDEKIPFDTTDYEKYRSADENEIKKMFASQILPSALDLAEIIFKKQWSIYCCEKPVFFTSDKPVVQIHPERKTFGVGTPGVEIFFPISPYRMLRMNDRVGEAPDGFYNFLEAGAAGFNCYTMGDATRFLISHEHFDTRLIEVSNFIDEVRIESGC